MATVDALVILRKTYETVLGFESWPYGATPVVASSTTPIAAAPREAHVEQMNGDPATVLETLAARGMAHVHVDGGISIQRFLNVGLIQRLVITRVPVLIGDGIPLFGPVPCDIALTHIATRHFVSGLVQSKPVAASIRPRGHRHRAAGRRRGVA
jgi:dihydrofolate reductase